MYIQQECEQNPHHIVLHFFLIGNIKSESEERKIAKHKFWIDVKPLTNDLCSTYCAHIAMCRTEIIKLTCLHQF